MEDNKQKKENKKKKKKYRGLRIFGRILLGLFIFIILVLLFVRSPWGQNIIKNQLISSISDKTNTKIEVDRLFITFSGNIFIDDLYLEDKQGDTLLYSDKFEAAVPLWPIIRGNGIAVNSVEWSGVRANVTRQDTINGFNFSFLMEALAPADTTATQPAQDTTSGGMQITLGTIDLSNFDVVYDDEVTGIDSRFKIGNFSIEMEETDLENMIFHASESSLSNAVINFKQTPVPQTPSEEESPMPVLRLEELNIDNVFANYESVPAGMQARIDLQEFYIEIPEIDLAEQVVDIGELQLNDSEVYFKTGPSSQVAQEEETDTTTTSEGFQWPEWKIEVAKIDFSNNRITYITGDATPEAGVFNPEAMQFREMNLAAQNLYLRNQTAGADINNFNFSEESGINLRNFSLEAGIDNTSFTVDDLLVELNSNIIEGNLDIRYDSIDDLMDNPQNSIVEANISQFNLDLSDLFLLQPDLRSNEYLVTLSQKPVYGEIRAEGTLASLQISQANVNWGASTSLAARGSIQNVTEPENLQFDFPRIRMISQKGDVRSFVDQQQLGINLPEEFTLTADVSGSTEAIDAEANLESSAGQFALDASYSGREGISFEADLDVSNLALGTILQNEQLGELNMKLNATGKGETINTLDATLDATVTSFMYNGYPIKDLRIAGEIEDGEGPVGIEYKDDNLNMSLESIVLLDSVAPQINFDLDVVGANLQALGLAQRDIRVALELFGSFRGNAEEFDVNAEINQGVAVYDNNSYLLGDFAVSARVRPDSTAVNVDNQILNLYLRSNTDPASFASALQRHYDSYFTNDTALDTVAEPVNLELRAEINENPILEEVFITNLQEMDTVKIAVDFNERRRELAATIEAPFINYMGNEIDSLAFHLNSARDSLEFDFGFQSLNAGPLAIQKTIFEGEVIDDILHLDFNSYYEEEHLVHVRSEITGRNDTIIFTLDPSEVILNSVKWEVPETNAIRFAENAINFEDFTFRRNNQLMEVTDDRQGMEQEHIALLFENFSLASFLSYLNPETPLASGRLNGNFTIEQPYGTTGLLAGLEINEFQVMEVPMGTLSLEGEAIGTERYNFDMAIKGQNIDLDLDGSYVAAETGAEWDSQLMLNRVDLAVVEGLLNEELSEPEGSFTGNISLSGTTADPQYEGEINFNDAGITVNMLGAHFVLPNETMRLDNEGVYFDNFLIQDQNNNNLSFTGEVGTESFLNPTFDLTFEADNFTALNSTEEDNDLYYGTVIFDADGSLTGNMNVPVIDLNLDIGSETNFTYVIPPSEIGIEERDGVVVFVNRENPENILTQTEGESFTLSGIDMTSQITVSEDAVFNVVIDEETGDNFQVVGEGDLRFAITPSGQTSLTGRYVLSGGHYEMNLYGLVSRRFEIVEGSTVTWAGDPLDASLDVAARYRVETSASDLMATTTSGASATNRDRFRQELPFLVYLYIDGEIMEPVLTFGLDMPEDEQGAVGGEVYGRVQQINQQEQQLNRQIFSLLVLNRFYPAGTSDGSSGGTLAMARDNLNSALADQLNLLSNNLLGNSGFELDFGLDTFTDYQGDSPQQRTQLDIAAQKSFLDDRLVVSVGSEVDVQGSSNRPDGANPLIGNVSIEYLVTENGRWRLKGFRRNRFENVIEGQVIVSGIALIFTREFNEWRELWNNLSGTLPEEDEEELSRN